MDQAMKRRKISSRNIDRHMKAKRTEDGKTQQISQLALIAMLMGTHTNNVKYRNCRKVFHGCTNKTIIEGIQELMEIMEKSSAGKLKGKRK